LVEEAAGVVVSMKKMEVTVWEEEGAMLEICPRVNWI
jgi:hypothetical protein